jgi:hypothetical protein
MCRQFFPPCESKNNYYPALVYMKSATIALLVVALFLSNNVVAQRPFDLFDSLFQQGQFPVPLDITDAPVFLGFFDSYTQRSRHDNSVSFRVDHYVKNTGDSSWHLNDFNHGLKISDAGKLIKNIRFQPSKYPDKNIQGISHVIFHDMQLFHIKSWSHTDPHCYQYLLEVFDRSNKRYQSFSGNVGLRAITQTGTSIRIDNQDIIFKAVELHSNDIPKNNTRAYLQSIKGHNFNTIILKSPCDNAVFNLCDSIGLYIVQEVSHAQFNSTEQMLEYLVERKEHPSFIAWRDVGLRADHARILRTLDSHRALVKDFPYGTVKNWNQLDSVARAVIKNKQQIFHVNVNTLISGINITRDEYFSDAHKITFTWAIRANNVVVQQDGIGKLIFRANVAEVALPVAANEFAQAGYSYEFSIIVREGNNSYTPGDTIALNKFQYVHNHDTLTLKRLY